MTGPHIRSQRPHVRVCELSLELQPELLFQQSIMNFKPLNRNYGHTILRRLLRKTILRTNGGRSSPANLIQRSASLYYSATDEAGTISTVFWTTPPQLASVPSKSPSVLLLVGHFPADKIHQGPTRYIIYLQKTNCASTYKFIKVQLVFLTDNKFC